MKVMHSQQPAVMQRRTHSNTQSAAEGYSSSNKNFCPLECCHFWRFVGADAEHNVDFSVKGKFTITALIHCVNLFICEALQQMLS